MLMRQRWDHNIAYHGALLDAVPDGARSGLDVGCGEGTFARRLAARVSHVDAIDKSPDMISAASRLGHEANITFAVADFMTANLQREAYDYVSFLASVHHMPLADALTKARSLVRPGGTLAILGLYRRQTISDLASDVVAFPVNRVLLIWHGRAPYSAPIADPTVGLREIRATASRILPGSRVRRLLLMRYLLIWQAVSHHPADPSHQT
jgi:SAM-dependent methyltransferase